MTTQQDHKLRVVDKKCPFCSLLLRGGPADNFDFSQIFQSLTENGGEKSCQETESEEKSKGQQESE